MEFWDLRQVTALLGYVLALGLLGLYVVILWKIATDRINIGTIISDSDASNKSSISRFQLLVFTMTIAGLYVILSLENGQLIDVPNGALTLLGISSSSFVVSKAVGKPKDPNPGGGGGGGTRGAPAPGPVPVAPAAAPNATVSVNVDAKHEG